MRRWIVIPKKHGEINRSFVNRNSFLLFERLNKELGFETIIEDHVEVPSNVGLVLTYKGTAHSNTSTLTELADLDKRVKLVSYVSDLHRKTFWKNESDNDKAFLSNLDKTLSRSDIILTRYWGVFCSKFQKYIYKAVHLPHFFAPYEKYESLGFNEEPINKCLLTGITPDVREGTKVYTTRLLIKKLNSPDIDVIKYPDYDEKHSEEELKELGFYINDSYIELLHSYLAGFATPSILKYTVAKYFEIPATGSLLLGVRTDDLDKLGFRPYKHYIPFTQDTIKQTVSSIVNNPQKYREIRLSGMEFVRKYHSINNRFNQLKSIINKL